MNRNWNFGWVFSWGKYYSHTRFLRTAEPEEKKGQIFFQRPWTRPQLQILKFKKKIVLCVPFLYQNSGD